MKVTWEAGDIRTGRLYGKVGAGEMWMIGYVVNVSGINGYVSVSMNDGMVTEQKTKEEMAKTLTECGYLPKEIMK